jgi:hypothetical protein
VPLLHVRIRGCPHSIKPACLLVACCCLQALVDGKNFPDAILDFNATLALLQRDPSADVARARLLSGACPACVGLPLGCLLANEDCVSAVVEGAPANPRKCGNACFPTNPPRPPLPLVCVQAGALLTRAWETGWQPWQTMTRH